MLALGIGKNDSVVTSPITFAASANCALYVGANPRFVDIDNNTYHLDVERLKDFLEVPSQAKRVKAVIPVHLMGTVSDVKAIRSICSKHGIRIVEDAAHALGAEYKNGNKWTKVGACVHSDIAIFSFHPIKHITTGEGGALLTNDKKIYETIRRLRHHGIVRSSNPRTAWLYDIPQVGFNFRITDFQCALGISQLKRLDAMVKKRRDMVRRYNQAFSNYPQLRLPYERKNTKASYHLYVIRIANKKRDRLYDYLRQENIFTQVNYIPVHLFSSYRRLGFRRGNFPVAENYYNECLSLPLYEDLTLEQQNRVINRVKGFLNHG